MTFGSSDIDGKVIPFINGRFDNEIFEKILIHTRNGISNYCTGIMFLPKSI